MHHQAPTGKNNHGHSGVPRENVIDLRKIQHEREIREQPKRSNSASFFQSLQKLSLPKFSFRVPRFSAKTKERVVVSTSRIARTPAPHLTAVPPPPPALTGSRADPPEPGERLDLRRFQLPSGWLRRLLGFSLVCVLIVVPIVAVVFYQRAVAAKGDILNLSQEAYELLQRGGSLATTADFAGAGQEFNQATQQFALAQQQLQEVGGAVLDVSKLVTSKAASAEHLLNAGQYLSQAGLDISSVVSSLDTADLNPLSPDATSLANYLSGIQQKLAPVQENLTTAVNELAQVEPGDVPEQYRDTIVKVQESIPALKSTISSFSSVTDVLMQVLGNEQPKRYLLVFQNNRELRPTGGFIGSIAQLDMYQGKIQKLEVPGGGVYDVAGQLTDKLISPKPLWLVNPHWNIQDANWFPDFPASAQKLMWFYERTGGTSVDGIISLTPQVIERLLEVSGPIDMRETYGVVVDQNNFVTEAQTFAEVTYDKVENKPKKFIGDLLPRLLENVFSADQAKLLNVLDVMNSSLQSKDFMLYFADAAAEKKVQELGWDGRMISTRGDYLQVVSTNIGGGKTDAAVTELISHQADIQPDGSIIDTVTITRAHRGNSLDQWEGMANVAYLRLYVPYGSTLIRASGFDDIPSFRFMLPDTDAVADVDLARIETNPIINEQSNTRITDEFGKTVFGNWVSIDPGEVQQVTISYRLPFTVDVGGLWGKTDSYTFYAQRQPGTNQVAISSTVTLPSNDEAVWASAGLVVDNQAASFAADLTQDKLYGLVIK